MRRLCATAILHPCTTRKLRVLPPAAPKIIPRLLSERKCGGVVELRSLGSVRPCADSVRPLSCILARRACSFGFASLRNFGQALSRILAFAVVVVAASVHRQPFVPLHLCNDSHLCRCIVQRLYVVAFMHPCITTLCDRYRASFARRACSVGFASCLVSRLGCRIVWQLSAADFKHPCLKLWAFIL